ncbi:hypothetical protein B9Z55_007103 [Caenorhabditis nigoni]|uniref:C2H2-type domain-containing protein n=1 Tax=Caenorhabditis nigoni TaxID=1611254 RepID=A0A2G5V814_9PELO|nr:hypothetical protein B9Z55_007103 [Caenorhabditis nigoni]
MNHGSNQGIYHQNMEDSGMLDEEEYANYHMGYPEEDEIVEGMAQPRAVHQCNVCNKIFVSFKGLQQHAVIHTDQKPFRCDICSKSFRFKSNLFEHRSVHTGFTPHACPYCGKTCRFRSFCPLGRQNREKKKCGVNVCHIVCGETKKLDKKWRDKEEDTSERSEIIELKVGGLDRLLLEGSRLKGNLKKHLRTHVTSKEELDAAWRPFASNRRPPADIPEDAIVVRGTGGGPYYTPPPKHKKKKLGLGEPGVWIEKIRRGDLLPQVDLDDKIRRLEDMIFNNLSLDRWVNLFEVSKSIAFETHDCPVCKVQFMTRMDCMSHHAIEHENIKEGHDYFCDKCFRPFADEDSFNKHMEYHAKVLRLMEDGSLMEAVLLAVSCDALAFGQEDINNDRITIEGTNTPDGAAKQLVPGRRNGPSQEPSNRVQPSMAGLARIKRIGVCNEYVRNFEWPGTTQPTYSNRITWLSVSVFRDIIGKTQEDRRSEIELKENGASWFLGCTYC